MSGSLAAGRPRSSTTGNPSYVESSNFEASGSGSVNMGQLQYGDQSLSYSDVNGPYSDFDPNMSSGDLLAALGAAGGTMASEPTSSSSSSNGFTAMDLGSISTDFKFPELPTSLLEQAPEYEYSAHTKANVFSEATLEDLARLMPESFDSGLTQPSEWSSMEQSYDSSAMSFDPYGYANASDAGPSNSQAVPPYGVEDWGSSITPRQATFNAQSIQPPYTQPLYPQQEVPFGHFRSTSTSAASQDYEPSIFSAGGATPSKQYSYDNQPSVKKRRASPSSVVSASPSQALAGTAPPDHNGYTGSVTGSPYCVDQIGRPVAPRVMGAPSSSIQPQLPYHDPQSIPLRHNAIPPGQTSLPQSYSAGQNPPGPYPTSAFPGANQQAGVQMQHTGAALFHPVSNRSNIAGRPNEGAPPPSTQPLQAPLGKRDDRRSSSSSSTNDLDDEYIDAPPPNPRAVALANAAIEGQSGTQQQQDMLIALNETMSMCLDIDGVARCPFPNCTKTFAKNRSYNLKTHLRSHSQLKPFACQSCPRAFSRKHDLERHARVHSGDKPYICEACGRGFPRSDALRRHWRVEKECGDKASEIEAGQPLPSLPSTSNGLHVPVPLGNQVSVPSQFPHGSFTGPNALPAGWTGGNPVGLPAGMGEVPYGNGQTHPLHPGPHPHPPPHAQPHPHPHTQALLQSGGIKRSRDEW